MEQFNFWEKVVDEDGEVWEREVPACHCSECGEAIYKDDFCYLMDNGAPVCDECMSWKKMTGKEALHAMAIMRRRGA